MKLVINKCFGGFSLSSAALSRIRTKLKARFQPIDVDEMLAYEGRTLPRNLPELISTVEALGIEANGSHAKLKVIEIPDGVDWSIDEYDGVERVVERSRSWY